MALVVNNIWVLLAATIALVSLWLSLYYLPNRFIKERIATRLLQKSSTLSSGNTFNAVISVLITNKIVENDYFQLKESLELSGRDTIQAQRYYLLTCWLIPLVLIAVIVINTQAVYAIILSGCCFILPRKFIRITSERSEHLQNMEAVELCQLTRMLAEAGLSLERSLRIIAHQGRPVLPRLANRLDRYNRLIDAGSDRTLALDELANNHRIIVLKNYALLMKQSTKLGSQVSHGLQQIIREARHAEQSRIKEETNRLGAKMTVVMMLFMLPALFVIIGGPALISIANLLGK